MLEVGAGPGRASERMQGELGADVVAVDQSERMVELTRRARSRGDSRRRTGAAVRETGGSTRPSRRGCSTTSRTSSAPRRAGARSRGRAAGSSPSRTAWNLSELWELVGETPKADYAFDRENGKGVLGRQFTPVEARDVDGEVTSPTARPLALRHGISRPRAAGGHPSAIRRAARRPPPRHRLRRGQVIRPAELIERKRDGDELSAEELSELVLGYTRGDVPDYQMSAFLMAVYFRGLSGAETFALTDAMIASGETIDLGVGARPQGRRQALDRRRGRQDVARGRADRRRVRRALREDVRPRARPHRRHARQARVDPRLPRRADAWTSS